MTPLACVYELYRRYPTTSLTMAPPRFLRIATTLADHKVPGAARWWAHQAALRTAWAAMFQQVGQHERADALIAQATELDAATPTSILSLSHPGGA